MRQYLRRTAWPLALVALFLISETRATGAPSSKETPKADCAFSNPGYSG